MLAIRKGLESGIIILFLIGVHEGINDLFHSVQNSCSTHDQSTELNIIWAKFSLGNLLKHIFIAAVFDGNQAYNFKP